MPEPTLSQEWQNRQNNVGNYLRDQLNPPPDKAYSSPMHREKKAFLEKFEADLKNDPKYAGDEEDKKALRKAILKEVSEELDNKIIAAGKEGTALGSTIKPGQQGNQGASNDQRGFITRAIDGLIGMLGNAASWIWDAMKNFMPGVSEWLGGVADSIKNTISPTTPEQKAAEAKEALAQGVEQKLSKPIEVRGHIFKLGDDTKEVLRDRLRTQDFTKPQSTGAAPSAPSMPNGATPPPPAPTPSAPAASAAPAR